MAATRDTKRPAARASREKGPPASHILALRKKLGMPQRVFARLVGLSERSLAKFEKGQPPGQAVRRQISVISRLHDALAEVVDPKDMGEWFQQPNSAFGGLKPLEIVERGQIDRIWAMVYDLGSGAPG